jgi:GH15 family glucan-1,4-alpha-glucosidase
VGAFVQVVGEPQLDSTALLLPVTGVVEWDDERMIATADAVAERLDDHGLIRRYEGDDGLPGREGAFLASSFWLAECLARQGREDEARRRYDRALEAATPLGLFAEEYDARRSRPLGNFPQGLTHLAHIGAALALAGDQALSAPRSRSPSST